MECPVCGGAASVGVLCARCLPPACPGLLPAHVSARATAAEAHLIDAFGVPHALSGGRTVIGRRSDADLAVLHASVSRDHAVIDGGQLRDLGSRNGTLLDGRSIAAAEPLPHAARVHIGEVGFVFVAKAVLPEIAMRSMATGHAAGTFRFRLEHEGVELVLIGESGGGLLLYGQRNSLVLSPLDLELLRLLCVRAVEDAASPAKTRGCVSTKQLLKALPFQSKLAGEENVRQAVHRLRADLALLGADELLASVPGRGYYVSWSVRAG
jgi:hypothetical protein